MSKKNKAKFKKQIKAQILEQMARAKTQAPTIASAPALSATPIIKSDTATITTDSTIQNLDQIKYDLKKTAIVVAGLALIIVALVLLDQKYGILLKFGAVLFKVLHIQ